MKFDTILTNPPFQDSVNRKKTPHKLWIDFTLAAFDRFLADDGSLIQVSPASFSSPSNIVLRLMQENQVMVLRLGTEHHFPTVASTFSDYWIRKSPNSRPTTVTSKGEQFEVFLDERIWYLPNDLSEVAISIHKKVMFTDRPRLNVEWDYVAAHNIRRHDVIPTLCEERTESHCFPVFHTNRSTWWSSIRQEWADAPKVMWTRSGYAKPFYDDGELGGTDMVYFVRVDSPDEGHALAGNLNSPLIRYILKTAKWSGFGNERVFAGLPQLPNDRILNDHEMFDLFDISGEEADYVRSTLVPRRGKA